MSYVRSRAEELGSSALLQKIDLHIHVPREPSRRTGPRRHHMANHARLGPHAHPGAAPTWR